MIRILLLVVMLADSLAYSQSPSTKDVDITAPEGTRLRATFFAAAKPGPGVLLLHMCNTTRKSWEPVAKKLSERELTHSPSTIVDLARAAGLDSIFHRPM